MSTKTKYITIDELIDKFKEYNNNEEDIKLVRSAYEYAEKKHFGQKRISGDDYILHPLNVALILTEISADAPCMAAALLHDTIEDSDATYEEIEGLFGKEVALLVNGVTKINRLNFSSDYEASAAYQRKILVGLSEDPRVIIIKLADRLHNMRTIDVLSEEKQKRKAKETLEILTPVAHRLGIYKIKSELEDLSLRYLKPEAYFDIVEKLNLKKTERDAAVSKMMNEVSDLLTEHNIPHEMKGRSKSIYSIYNKLCKGKKFDDIYDILALRVFVDTEQECYLALGLIHSKYKPVPKRFKDYIAMPKTNLYQSLHTTVFGIDGQLFEIQIRTYEMDKIAEYGIASHWSYKENKNGEKSIKDATEQKLQIFRNIIELNEDSNTSEEFVSSVKKDILSNDVIYVYTPKGDVIELPQGATPIDFAYKVHTSIGDKMVGAIVNDSIVPLDYELKDGDIVKINVNKNSKGPSKEWINIVFTSQARNRIKSFYTKIDKGENIKKGEELIKEELRKQKAPFSLFNEKLNLVLDEFSESSLEDIYLSVGNGKYNALSVVNVVTKEAKSKDEIILNKITNVNVNTNPKNDIIVSGVDEIKVNLANCCKPVKGDDIIGYITKGNGIVVHTTNCHNIVDIDDRIIPVEWNYSSDNKYKTQVVVKLIKKDNILVDLIRKASTSNATILSINLVNNSDYQTYNLLVLVENVDKLKAFLNDLYQMKEVIEVERLIQ